MNLFEDESRSTTDGYSLDHSLLEDGDLECTPCDPDWLDHSLVELLELAELAPTKLLVRLCEHANTDV
jgi:hypothetical protein